MNYKEVRIGNYVMYDNRMLKIDALIDGSPILSTIGVLDWNNIKSIILTKELAFNFGFKPIPNSNKLQYKCCIIEYINDYGRANVYFCDSQRKHYYTCIYVHDIQNVYYDVYREELEFVNEPINQKTNKKMEYEIHIGEVLDLKQGFFTPKQVITISHEQKEAIEYFADTKKDVNLNTIYIINNVRFKIIPKLN